LFSQNYQRKKEEGLENGRKILVFLTIPSSQVSGIVLSPGPKVNDVRTEIAPDSTSSPLPPPPSYSFNK